ncbi:MAG: hypothetical protein QNJ44_14140 [Rhodobacter sp.]|nr:hypothetical protein [Rhodobacter sp.]
MLAATVLTLAACAVDPFEIPLLGPYREPNDPCREVGPGPDTRPLMAPDADLVVCPNDPAILQLFLFDVNAAEVKRVGDWVLLRVPKP